MLSSAAPTVLTPDAASDDSQLAWFCLRSQPKHEHIAAAHLRRHEGIEVLNPRVRFARPTRQGRVWVTEALFPNYIFARFDWRTSLTRIHYAPGVSGVVHFGNKWPTVPDAVMNELRAVIGKDEVHVVPMALEPGDNITIAGGAFHGLEAVITQVMPGRERVMVLLEFLGRQTTVEVGVMAVVKEGFRR
jgi:transcriptional antiterminator RfaH